MKKYLYVLSNLILINLMGCQSTGIYGNTPNDRGPYIYDPESFIHQTLTQTLYDPDSVKNLEIGAVQEGQCSIGAMGVLYAWVIPATFNAKNQFGGYVGRKTTYYWYVKNQFVGTSSYPKGLCPETVNWTSVK